MIGRSVGRLDDVHHPLADLDGEVGLGEREALRRVLVADRRAGMLLLQLAAQLGGVDGDVDDAVLVEAEHDLALQRVGRVVEVHDRPRRALDALVGALDQLLPALHQHLDRDVVGDQVLLDQLADEVEVGLARRREADLDLLEAHLDEGVEHAPLADGVHRVDQRLVAVAEVDRAPQRGLVDDRVRATCGRGARAGRTGRYLSNGIGRGVVGGGGMWVPRGRYGRADGDRPRRKMKNPPAGRAGGGRTR